jgi:hypothetical protein
MMVPKGQACGDNLISATGACGLLICFEEATYGIFEMIRPDKEVERYARELFEADGHKNLTWDLRFTERRTGMDTLVTIGDEQKRTYIERARAEILGR